MFPQTSNQTKNLNKSRNVKNTLVMSVVSPRVTCTLCPQSIWRPVHVFKSAEAISPSLCVWPLTPRKRAIMPAQSAILTVVVCLEKKISKNICGAWKRTTIFIYIKKTKQTETAFPSSSQISKSVPSGNLSRWLGRRANRPELGIKSRVCRRASAEEEMQEQQLQPGALR